MLFKERLTLRSGNTFDSDLHLLLAKEFLEQLHVRQYKNLAEVNGDRHRVVGIVERLYLQGKQRSRAGVRIGRNLVWECRI